MGTYSLFWKLFRQRFGKSRFVWTNLDSRVDNGRYIMEWVEEMTLCGDWDFFGIKVKGSEEPRRVAYCGITYFDVNSEGKVYRQVEHFDVMNLLKELGVLKAIVEKMK